MKYPLQSYPLLFQNTSLFICISEPAEKPFFVSVSGDPFSFLLQYRQDRWEGDPGYIFMEAALLDDGSWQRFASAWATEHSMRSPAPVVPWYVDSTHPIGNQALEASGQPAVVIQRGLLIAVGSFGEVYDA